MKTEERFIQDFPDVAARIGTLIERESGGAVKPQLPVGVGETEIELLTDMNEVHDRMMRTMELGVIAATLLNLHPWDLKPSGPHHFGRVIPACPIGQSYARYTFDAYQIDIADRGGKFKPTELWPMQLARDIVQQYPLAHGGLVCYMGVDMPGKLQNARANDQFLKDFESAHKRQINYYHELVDEANKLIHQKDGHMSISSRHRLAAQYLHRWEMLKELPKWISERAPGSETPRKFCDKCGAEVSDAGFACAKCGYITNPALAFDKGELDETSEGGLLALRRLSRSELDKRGLKHIETLAELRERRTKEAAKEAKKPRTE